jgi:hypothetical protein
MYKRITLIIAIIITLASAKIYYDVTYHKLQKESKLVQRLRQDSILMVLSRESLCNKYDTVFRNLKDSLNILSQQLATAEDIIRIRKFGKDCIDYDVSSKYFVYVKKIQEAKDEFSPDIVEVWVEDRIAKTSQKLLTTVHPERASWYMPDGKDMIKVPIDSITAISRVHIIKEEPLQLLVSGVPDVRNTFSHIIDVAERRAWFVPANNGLLGITPEEGYLVFSSYRYVSGIGGRYSYLQIYDLYSREMVASLDLDYAIYGERPILTDDID